jgi:hypothetical protein
MKAEIKVAKRTQKRRSVSPPNPQEAKREAKEAKRAAAAAAAPALDRSKPNELRQVSRNAAAVANVERALGPAQFAQALEHRKRGDSKGIQLFVRSSETSSVDTEIVDRIASAYQDAGRGGNRHVLAAATARVPGRTSPVSEAAVISRIIGAPHKDQKELSGGHKRAFSEAAACRREDDTKDEAPPKTRSHHGGQARVQSWVRPRKTRKDSYMHFIDVRQKAFYLTEEIVGVQLAVLDKPMAIATQVLNYDTDWPDWGPKVRAGSKTLTCECVVLPPREFVRLAEEVAGRDRSS